MVLEIIPGISLGGERPVLIAGPCAVETVDVCMETAKEVKDLARKYNLPYIFKSSFDKANRTAHTSFRTVGFEVALDILKQVRDNVGVPVLTDVHLPKQVKRVAKVVDVLQIPAFLCRQTDLIQEAGRTGLPVNIKKGQFMAPEDMAFAAEKVHAVGNEKVFLTERGSFFGYRNLVVDMRSIPIMRQYAPVVFDVTHSVQIPGGEGGTTGGQRQFAPFLARAAASVGVDGFYIETHPDPSHALSDGPNMVPLDELDDLVKSLVVVWEASKPYIT